MPAPNKAIMFYSAPTARHIPYFIKHGVTSFLISYHYVKTKRRDFLAIAEYVKECGGYLMIDSGAFTFKNDADQEKWTKVESYKGYLDEFLGFCYDNAKHIYCTVNMDMDRWVGNDVVDKWNEDLFKPLEKVTNVIYNIDVDKLDRMDRAKDYCQNFDYIGIGRPCLPDIHKIVTLAKLNKNRIHGFAITSLVVLKPFPLFSVDSTTWLSGARYGSTYMYDGKNFTAADNKNKHRRKAFKSRCEEYGIDYDAVIADNQHDVTDFNIKAWTGFEKEYLKIAGLKLNTKNASSYDKRHTRYDK